MEAGLYNFRSWGDVGSRRGLLLHGSPLYGAPFRTPNDRNQRAPAPKSSSANTLNGSGYQSPVRVVLKELQSAEACVTRAAPVQAPLPMIESLRAARHTFFSVKYTIIHQQKLFGNHREPAKNWM